MAHCFKVYFSDRVYTVLIPGVVMMIPELFITTHRFQSAKADFFRCLLSDHQPNILIYSHMRKWKQQILWNWKQWIFPSFFKIVANYCMSNCFVSHCSAVRDTLQHMLTWKHLIGHTYMDKTFPILYLMTQTAVSYVYEGIRWHVCNMVSCSKHSECQTVSAEHQSLSATCILWYKQSAC